MHSLFNPVQKRLATLEADSAPVANPEPRLSSRLVVVIIIIIIVIVIIIIANGCHAFKRDAWAAMRSSTKIKKKQEIRPPDFAYAGVFVCVYVWDLSTRERAAQLSRGQNEADPRVGRWLSLLHYFILLFFFFYLFTNCTATSVSFSYVFFFLLLFLFPVTSVLLLLVSVEVRGRMRV